MHGPDNRWLIVRFAVTFAQLRCVRHGRPTGLGDRGGAALGVSEPAVSSAVAALRRDLGDELFVRVGRRDPASRAGGERARRRGGRDPRARGPAPPRGRRGARRARACCGWPCRPPSPSTCRRRCSTRSRAGGRRSRSRRRSPRRDDFGALLLDRRADVALGPRRRRTRRVRASTTVPFLRYKLIVVAGSEPSRSRRRTRHHAARAARRALARRAGRARSSQRLFAERRPAGARAGRVRHRGGARRRRPPAGQGVMLAIAHTVLDAAAPRHAACGSTCAARRATACGTPPRSSATGARAAAGALRRFVTTPRRRRRSSPGPAACPRAASGRRST